MSRATKVYGGTKVISKRVPDSINREGYPAFTMDEKERFVQTLLTNIMGHTFYVKSNDLIKESEDIHTAALNSDPEFVAKALVYARNEGYMRLQPTYGLAQLSKVSSELFKNIFEQIILTPNDLIDFYAIRGSGGRAVKTAVSHWLVNKMSPYWAIKYGSESKECYTLRDILRVSHPKSILKGGIDDWTDNLFNYLCGGDADITELNQIQAFENLKAAKTDEDKVIAIIEGRLPHEVATSFAGDSNVVWNAIAPQMPIFALLKNLATLERHGVLDSNKKMIQEKFSNAELISKSKILPYRFLEAEKHVNASWVKDSLRDALELSFSNIPNIEGKTAVFLDNSGSMSADYIKAGQPFMVIASIYAISLMKKIEDGILLTFNTSLKEVPVSKRDSVLTQANRITANGGTQTSLPFSKILYDKEKFDNIVLITDGQENHGQSVYQVLADYQKRVNDKVKLFVIDVSPYGNKSFDSIAKNIYCIHGWSDKMLNFISLASKGFDSVVNMIEKTSLTAKKNVQLEQFGEE